MFLPLMFAVDKARAAHSRRRPGRGSCFLVLCGGTSPTAGRVDSRLRRFKQR